MLHLRRACAIGYFGVQQYVPFLVSAMTGIMALRFSSTPVSSPRQQLTGGNFKANLALSHYMRECGVYLPELHTIMLSIAHGDAELAVVSDAFRAALISMKADGFSSTPEVAIHARCQLTPAADMSSHEVM
jgi:hypothetical protein